MARRRAESKKLEESYTHKAVMAKSFVGYKRMIEKIEADGEDKKLLKKHMENFLKDIYDNSSNFLNHEGESYPLKIPFLQKSNNYNKEE